MYSLSKKLFYLAIMFAVGFSASGITWDFAWDAQQLPEAYTIGNKFVQYTESLPGDTTVTRTVENGIYTVETVSDSETPSVNSNSFYKMNFDGSLPSTIEFRYKGETSLSTGGYTTALFIRQEGVGSLGIKFRANNQTVDYYDYNINFMPSRDLENWSRFRILTNVSNGELVSADVYFADGDGDWVFGLTAPLQEDAGTAESSLIFGDIGSNWGGRWNEDYFYWTHQGASLDPIAMPEPVEAVWTWMYEANNLPESSNQGALRNLNYAPSGTEVHRSVENGIYTVETTGDDTTNANSHFESILAKFDSSRPATIEFRINNQSSIISYTNFVAVRVKSQGWIAFNFTDDHTVNPYSDASPATAYRDAEGFSTFRVLTEAEGGTTTSADIFYKNAAGHWVYMSTDELYSIPTMATDAVSFGDGGGNWGGVWSVDYFYWTNQAATLQDVRRGVRLTSDLNNDGSVNLKDFAILAENWFVGSE